MTWQEIDALDRSTIVVATFGAMEQHGTHLPMATDTLIGQEIARRLDAACGQNLLVLPTQWLGLSLHHMSFSGTISTSVETYLAMAFEILGSIAQAGFRKILVINSHGGNVSALDLVLTKCREAYPSTHMVGVTYWNAAATQLRALRESRIGGMGHACELETSLVLAISPEFVRNDRLEPDGRQAVSEFAGKDMLQGGSITISRHFSEISRNGAVGDPSTASAEKGERFFEAITNRLKALVGEIETGRTDEFHPIGD